MNIRYLDTRQGRKLAYCQTDGAGPGVVFLGGFSSDMDGTKALDLESWARERGRAFLRFDYSGHGRSSERFDEGCIGDWAQDAAEVLQSLTSGPQVLVGSSMGGWISLILATRFPDRIAGLVGIAAAPDFTDDFRRDLRSSGHWEILERDGRVELPSEYSSEPLVLTKRLIDDGPANFVLDKPLRLPFPVRLLQGTDDADVDRSVALTLLDHASCDDLRLTLVKGADHRFSTPECLRLIKETVESLCSS